MRTLSFAPLAAALTLLLAASPSLAQNAAATPHPAPATAPRAAADAGPPRFGRTEEHSLGMRLWLWNTPAWLPGLFAHVEGDWSGPLTASPGLEYVYRRNRLDVVLGVQWMDLSTGAGYLRGRSEPDIALERIESSLWFLNVNGTFLWSVPIADWVEFQGGVGLMLGYVGGSLYRTQVYRGTNGQPVECFAQGPQGTTAPPPPGGTPTTPTQGGYCGVDNNHYRYSDGTRYAEPSMFNGGSIPRLMLMPTLPHLAFHFRPHRHVDIRVDGGFALAGFFGGIAAHYVF